MKVRATRAICLAMLAGNGHFNAGTHRSLMNYQIWHSQKVRRRSGLAPTQSQVSQHENGNQSQNISCCVDTT